MTDHPGGWHPLARTREEDLEILANGGETGWWDDTGQPAPWPQDLLDPEAGWTTADPNKPGQSSTEHDPHNPPF